MRYYCEEKEAALKELESSRDGLSEAEAAARLERDGKNRLEAAKELLASTDRSFEDIAKSMSQSLSIMKPLP